MKRLNLIKKHIPAKLLFVFPTIKICVLTFALTIYIRDNGAIKVYLNKWRKEKDVPAVVVSFNEAGQEIKTYNSGFANINATKFIKNDSLFRVGSITKTFISAMILKLEAQGKLSINDKIGKWFPEYPRWKNITIKQLLNMTSGIANFSNLTNDNTKQWQPSNLINLAYQQQDLFSPGKQWNYSNTNYLLAGMIIEKITGQSLKQALNDNIFKPLKLDHTYYVAGKIPKKLLSQMAQGYHGKTNVIQINGSIYGAGGAVVSTTADISTWIQALFTKELPQKQLNELMTTVPCHNAFEPKGSEYGLGIFSYPTKERGTVWWYTGTTQGYSALFAWIPQTGQVITAATNRIPTNTHKLLFPGETLFKHLLADKEGT